MSTLYPESRQLEAMKYWTLPKGREYELDELCANGEYFAQQKMDGAWYMFERAEHYNYLFGRNISKTTGELTEKSDRVPHIISALSNLPPNTILLGEIYYPHGESKDTTSIMGALAEEAIKRQEKRGFIHYYLFDILAFDGVDLCSTGAWDRYRILEAVYKKYLLDSYGYIDLAESFTEDIQQRLAAILASGGEGIVLKKKDFPYQCGKRPAYSSCKVKKMDTIDLVCCGFCDPTREYTGKEIDTWTYWEEIDNETGDKRICGGHLVGDDNRFRYTPVTKPYALGWKTAIKIGAYNEIGELIEVGTVSSGLTDELRSDFTQDPNKYLGRVCELSCMSVDRKEHTLRHPVFKRWRDDKDAKACVINELFA